MKKLIRYSPFWIMALIVISSCSDPEVLVPSPNGYGSVGKNSPKVHLVSEDIGSDQTWYSGNTYILSGRIQVLAPSQLTIQPGVIIKFTPNFEGSPSLIVTRGAKIKAEGTLQQPIIFTSIHDQILPGEIVSKMEKKFITDNNWWDTGKKPTFNNNPGIWGGILILGKAKGSFPGDKLEIQFQESLTREENFLFGGLDDEDNSGILKYVSIRFSGDKYQELAGLTLAGVGAQTIIEKVEVYASSLDGISVLGGKVELRDILIETNSRNSFSANYGWRGALNNFFINQGGNFAFDLQGPKGTEYLGNHSISKGTVNGWLNKGLIHLNEDSNTDFKNVYFNNLDKDLEFGWNLMPSKYPSQFGPIEVHIVEGYIHPVHVDITKLFKGIEKGMVNGVDWGKNSMGADMSQFEVWSLGYLKFKGGLSN